MQKPIQHKKEKPKNVNLKAYILTLVLVILGSLIIALANTFHLEILKIKIDQLLAELGAIILVVCLLHWLYELVLRKEMLREVSESVTGNIHLHDMGLADCTMNSKTVNDREYWRRAPVLTIGVLYSPKFFKDNHDIIKTRQENKLPTKAIILSPTGSVAKLFDETKKGSIKIDDCIDEIREMFEGELNKIRYHNSILRYSFILTNEYIWVKLYTNSPERTEVPALKVRAGTPLYAFFENDIARLWEHSDESE